MKWIGLTGGIATGKSTVADIFRDSGVPVVNADEVAHRALVASSPVFANIVQTFGQDVVGSSGDIDRAVLGKKIFANSDLRLKLDAIVHPFVRQEVSELKKRLQQAGHKLAIYDVPLLFEKNMQKDFDKIVVVSCDAKTQKARLMKRNGLSEEEAQQRISAQLSMSEKIRGADFLIENNGTLEELIKTVKYIQAKL